MTEKFSGCRKSGKNRKEVNFLVLLEKKTNLATAAVSCFSSNHLLKRIDRTSGGKVFEAPFPQLSP